MTSYLQLVLRLRTYGTFPYTLTCFQGPVLRVMENFRLADSLTYLFFTNSVPLTWCTKLKLRKKFGILLNRKSSKS